MANDNNDGTNQPQEPVAENELKLTPAQALELERLRSETAAFRADAAKSQAAIEAMNTERRGLFEKLALTKALSDCGVRFHSSPSDTAEILRLSYDVVTDDNGSVAIDKATGQTLPLHEALQHLALNRPTLCDQRSLRHLKGEVESDGTPVIKSKADFKTDQQKREYIRTKGLDAFEMLPLRPVDLSPPKSFEDFTKLPLSQKTKLISQHGDGYVKSLPRANDLAGRLGRAGIKTNKTGK